MNIRLTTKVQRTGHRYVARRMESALVSRDSSEIAGHDSWRRKAAAMVAVVVVIVVVIGVVDLFILSKGRPGDAKFVVTAEGAQFVLTGTDKPVWHPVTNPLSARLILGENVKPKKVKASSLSGAAVGPLMGIRDAPESMDVDPATDSSWAVCSMHTPADAFDLTVPASSETTILTGITLTPAARRVGDGAAILARSTGDDTAWVLTSDGRRMRFDPDSALDLAVLGVTEQAVAAAAQVAPEMLTMIPQLPDLAVPEIAGKGHAVPGIAGASVGDVLVADVAGRKVNYVAGYQGIEQITDFVARLLTASGSATVPIGAEDLAATPTSDVIDADRYPSVVTSVVATTGVCATWDRLAGSDTAVRGLFAADTLPVDPAGSVVAEVMPSTRTTADRFASPSPAGHYVRVTGDTDTSIQTGQLFWISDAGVRYPIGTGDDDTYTPTLTALGLDGRDPLPVPWPFIALLPEGATLSPAAARIMAGTGS